MNRHKFVWMNIVVLVTLLLSGSPMTSQPAVAATPPADIEATPYVLQGVVGDGTPGSCTEAALDTALAGGGTVTFNCGGAPHTITLTNAKTITADTLVDGEGLITLSGGSATRLFRVNADATLALYNITLSESYSNADGGAIYNALGGKLIIDNSTLRDNQTSSSFSGGAIVSYGPLTITNSLFENNQGGSGGAVYPRWGEAIVYISNTVFRNNQALSDASGYGGALLLWDGPKVNIVDSLFESNQARFGGAIYSLVNSTLRLEQTTLVDNSAAAHGGALYNQATLALIESEVLDNSAFYAGGGLFNMGGTVYVEGSRFYNNVLTNIGGESYGGGIYNTWYHLGGDQYRAGAITLESSEMQYNQAMRGAAIDSNGTLTLTHSLLAFNQASERGGGLFSDDGQVILTNSTLSDNSAAFHGGALYKSGGTLTVQFSTLANNTADDNSTIYFDIDQGDTSAFIGVLVEGDCVGDVATSYGVNLETGASCGFVQSGDLQNTDPQLGDLTNNGGATQTRAPLPSSPAIDAGGLICPATDQRGEIRPAGDACDIGAVEVQSAIAPTYQPASVPNGQKPTINLNVTHGYIGQTITATGQAPASASGVRLFWALQGGNIMAAQVAKEIDNTYTAVFNVTELAQPGATQLCAMGLGGTAATTAVACTPFTFDTPPNGEIEGELPPEVLPEAHANGANGAALLGTTFNLLDRAGNVLASTPVNTNGRFQLNNIPPGVYFGAVTGNVNQPVTISPIDVLPALRTFVGVGLAFGTTDPVTGGVCEYKQATIPGLAAKYTDNTFYTSNTALSQSNAAALPPLTGLIDNTMQWKLRFREDFGTFISGATLVNEFTALAPQGNNAAAVSSVQYHIKVKGESNARYIGQSSETGYRITYNVGALPAGQHTLYAAPIINGQRQCPIAKTITVAPNPVANAYLVTMAQNEPNAPLAPSIWFDYSTRSFHFAGTIPNTSFMPPSHPNPPQNVPYIGSVQGRFSGGIDIVGYMKLNGVGEMTTFRPRFRAELLGEVLCDINYNYGPRPLVVDPKNLSATRINLPYRRVCNPYFYKQTYNGVLWSGLWGIITLRLRVRIGLDGEVYMGTEVKPFVAQAGADLYAGGQPLFDATLWIDVLRVVSAGADINPNITAFLDSRAQTPNLGPPFHYSACAAVAVRINLWARALGKKWNLYNFVPIGFADCLNAFQASTVDPLPLPPRVMASPAIAADAAGAQLMVSVEDETPEAPEAQPRVEARFWDANTQTWGAPTPLSESGFGVNDPVAAFYGTNGEAIVAWSQNTIAPSEADSYGDDLGEILKHQEMYFARWDGSTWLTTTRITSDTVPDGRPAIAGDITGLTLAWTRDTDGEISTTLDSRIAVVEWDSNTNSFGPMELLDGNTPGALIQANAPATNAGLNFQISIARRAYPEMDEYRTALAWTFDGDGDLDTGSDRRVAVAYRSNTGGVPGAWVALNPQPLPPRVATPSIALREDSPDAIQLAFITTPVDPDNVSESFVSKSGEVWTADLINLDATPQVTARALTDVDGSPVHGERPLIAQAANNEILVAFRQFSTPGEEFSLNPQPLPPRELGVLAVSRGVLGTNATTQAPPVSLTDGTQQFWQPAVTVDPLSNRLRVTGVLRTGALSAASQSATLFDTPMRAAALNFQQLSPVTDPVISLDLPDAGDPALTAALTLSRNHAPAGNNVLVTALGRNLGRRAVPVTVSFYAGHAPDGTLLDQVNVGTVEFNQPFTATFSLARTNGAQPVYAVVSADSNLDTSNDTATGDLGALPAPEVASVTPSIAFDHTLEIHITPPDAEAVAGYRILRSIGTTGVLQLVGETSNLLAVDQSLTPGVTYCYAVQAYDSAGQISATSLIECGQLPLSNIYLPLVLR